MLEERVTTNIKLWLIVLTVVNHLSTQTTGDISSLYDTSDHYWDFEQDSLSKIKDKRTSTKVTFHGGPGALLQSPTGQGLHLDGSENPSSVDLLTVNSGSCLFDPSNCPNGLSIAMFLKFRPRGKLNTVNQNYAQAFFGNSAPGADSSILTQGVVIFYKEWKESGLYVAVYGSTSFCSIRYSGVTLNSWFHLHLKWTGGNDLLLYIDGSTNSVDRWNSRNKKCGAVTSPLPTEKKYSLGAGAFPTAYYDNIAIWNNQELLQPFLSPWEYISDHGDSTTLSLTIRLEDKIWDENLNDDQSQSFIDLQGQVIDQLQTLFIEDETELEDTEVYKFTSGSINAFIRLTFKSVDWKETLNLQEDLENATFLDSNASITDCSADDGFYCNGTLIKATSASKRTRSLIVYLNQLEGVNDDHHLKGYCVFYKQTNTTNEWQRAAYHRGGWEPYQHIGGLKPYTNYSIRASPRSFKTQCGLIGPIAIFRTKEDVPSVGPVILQLYVINSSSLFVHWNESSIPKDNWRGIPRGFRVHGEGDPCSQFKITIHDVALNVSSFTVTGLEAGVRYAVKVSGRTTPGAGADSQRMIRTNNSVPSRPPTNIQLYYTSRSSLRVTWDEVDECFMHGVLSKYGVYLRDVEGNASDFVWNVTVPAVDEREVDFTGLETYWNYGVQISAFTLLGTGPTSAEITSRTDEWVPPVPPYDVNATKASSTSIHVTWKFNNTARNVLGILTKFRVFYKRTNLESAPVQTLDVGENVREILIPGLAIYRFYNISVAGFTRIGRGVKSEDVMEQTAGEVPGHGPVPLIMFNTSSTSLHVAWGEVPEEYRYSDITGYRVFLRETGNPNTIIESKSLLLHENTTDFTGLKKFTSYTASVLAYSDIGDGVEETVTAVTDEDVPSQAPSAIELFNTSSTSLKARWGTVLECCRHGIVTGYQVFLRDNNTGEFVKNETTTDSEFELDFLNLEKYYRYSVYILAFTRIGAGPVNEGVFAMTEEDVPIRAPFNLSGHNTSAWSLLVEWNFDPNERHVLGILLGYHVFYTNVNNSGGLWESQRVADPLARQTELPGLEEYRDYNITIRAYTRIGDGVNSDYILIRTDEYIPRAPPSYITGQNTSSTSLWVDWGEVPFADQLGIILGYRLLVWRTNESAVILRNFTVSVPSRNTSVVSLEKYTNYTVVVSAFTVKGQGNFSEPFVVITDEDIPSQAPTRLELFNTSSTSLKALWGTVLECCRHGIVTGYQVFLRDNDTGKFVKNETTTDSEFELDFLNLEKYYRYSVYILAFTRIGAGPVSEGVLAMTEEDVPIRAPFNLSGHNTSAWSLLVQWDFDPNERHVLGILLGYHVFYMNVNNSGALWESQRVSDPLARQTELLGLEEYRDYNITIRAYTRIGDGVNSDSLLIRTDEYIPRAPPSYITGKNTSSTSLWMDWGEVPFADQLGIILGYRLLVWRTNESAVILRNFTVSVPSRNTSVVSLEKYTNYTIEVSAFTVKGEGNFSEPFVVITDEDIPTWKPSQIAAWNTTSTSILVSWQPLADTYYLHGVLRGYTVTHERTDGLFNITAENTSSSSLSLEVPGLDEYVEYNVSVRAFTVKGAGPSAQILCLTDEDVPAASPQNISGYNVSKHDIRVFWDRVPKHDVNGIILGYRVLFSDAFGANSQVFNVTAEFPAKNTTLNFLRPFTFYSISVLAYTIKGDGAESPPIIVRTEEEAPQVPPWNVTGHNSSSTSIYIQWSPIPPELVAGILRNYKVIYEELNDLNEPISKESVTLPVDQLSVTFSGLSKYTNYSLEVQGASKFFGVHSSPITVITDEDVPSSPPLNITSTNTSSTSLLITWDHIPKKLVHGILRGYRVFYRRAHEDDNARIRRRRAAHVVNLNETVETLLPNTTFLLIAGLNKFTNYSFSVVGFTSKGDGNVSRTFVVSTDEDVPSEPPVALSSVNLTGAHSIPVSWEPVPKGCVHGILLGYRVLYKTLTVTDKRLVGETLIHTVNRDVLSTTLEDLENYAVYSITVLAFTIKGDGAESDSVIAETCKCPSKLSTNWYSLVPYMKRNEDDTVDGPFPFILDWAAGECCTPCANGHGKTRMDYEHDAEGDTAEKANVTLVEKNVDRESDITFPLLGFKGQTAFGIYRYIPLMQSAGVALVAPLPTPEERTNIVLSLATAVFPLLIIAFFMILLAGGVMWALENRGNPEEFPPSFVKGLFSGAWWAFITCTTLGYGDKCPRSFLGRVFGIVWTLAGLVLMTLLMASMTDELISYTVQSAQKTTYGAKVGAIQDSPEYKLGIRMTADVNPGKKYSTYGELNEGLTAREVEGALIDLYTLANDKNLSSNTNLRIHKVFDYKKTYGVVLAGRAMKLEKCFLSFLQIYKGDIFNMIQQSVKTAHSPEESLSQEISSGMFDPTATQFVTSMIIVVTLFIIAVICGLSYHICRAKKRRLHLLRTVAYSPITAMRAELRHEVDEFYTRFTDTVNALRENHAKERQKFFRRKQDRLLKI